METNENYIWEFGKDEHNKTLWYLISPGNNEEVARSSQGFYDLSGCIKNAKKMGYKPRISKRRKRQ